MLNETANDLANVNTVGYNSSRVSFSDSLTQVLRGASGSTVSNGGSNPLQVGLGVQVAATESEIYEGPFQSTNDPLNVAIEGQGFLRVGTGTPPAEPPYTAAVPKQMDYTRAGNLTTNTKGFLTTQAGDYVIRRDAVATVTPGGTTYAPGTEASYLVIPPGSANVSIGQDGAVTYENENPASPTYQQQVTAGYLSLAQFANQSGLEPSAARYGHKPPTRARRSWAPPTQVPSARPWAASSKMSNVDLASEMTNMITAERGYQANSRVITTADEMLQTAVTMVQG